MRASLFSRLLFTSLWIMILSKFVEPFVTTASTPRLWTTSATGIGARAVRGRSKRTDFVLRRTLLHDSKDSEHDSLHHSTSPPSSSASKKRQAKYEQLMNATTLSLAPMMEYTDRYFRHLVRLVSSQTLLYTEMVATNTLTYERLEKMQEYREQNPHVEEETVRNNYDDHYLQRYLRQGGIEAPSEGASVLQVGGSDPEKLFQAAQVVMDMTDRGHCDYTAFNLNCGCPSPKVAGKGCFGAALMEDGKLVAELTQALHDGSQGQVPVTVKCRIGTDIDQPFYKKQYAEMDEEQEYAGLCRFIETVASGGVVTDFSVHARIAVLSRSFSPADNRKIPPLKYSYIQRLVEDYPELTFSLNGGVESLSQVQEQLQACPGLKGVMVGRAWAADPWSFSMADSVLYDKTCDDLLPNRLEILKAYGKYADYEEACGDPVRHRRFLIKAITPLFTGETSAKRYRIALDQIAGMPKKLRAQGESLEGLPPLSEMILNCACDNLSEEVLLRSRKDSYELILEQEAHKKKILITSKQPREQMTNERSAAVQEWQEHRKAESDGSYERMLESGGETEEEESTAAI